jgi:Glycosyl transferase family 90
LGGQIVGTLTDAIVDAANGVKIAKYLRPALGTSGHATPIAVRFDGKQPPWDISFERLAQGYQVTYSSSVYRRFQLSARFFLRAYFHWFQACGSDVRRMSVNGSDGNEPSLARFAACARPGGLIPIPDPHFYHQQGFPDQRKLGQSAPPWSGRSDRLVWRGGLNGAGRLTLDPGEVGDLSVLPRQRLVLMLSWIANCDVKFSEIAIDRGVWTETCRQAGWLGEPVSEASWLNSKYAIDIDGHANTWSNFLVRMLFGCCVFKVESGFGFRQWYYDRLKPFEHFVPVRADLADLIEKIEWARSHQNEAQEIAAAGQRFAMALDFEAGKRDAVEIISANWDVPS